MRVNLHIWRNGICILQTGSCDFTYAMKLIPSAHLQIFSEAGIYRPQQSIDAHSDPAEGRWC